MRVGIVGCGVIGRLHLEHLLAQGHEIVGIVDEDRNRAEKMSRELTLGDVVHKHLIGLLEMRKPDVVHVTTPPQSHAHLTVQALQAGCHVLVEKPMAITLSDADKMTQVAKQHRRLLSVAHTQHFIPVIHKAYQFVNQKKLGELLSAEIHIGVNASTRLRDLNNRHWMNELPGGVCYDLAPHGIYLLLRLIGEARKVHSLTKKTGFISFKHPDEIKILIEGERALGTISISLNTKPDMHYLNLYGTEKTLHINLTTMVLIIRQTRSVPRMLGKVLYHFEEGLQNFVGVTTRAFQVFRGQLKTGDEHGLLIKNYYQSIECGGIPPVTSDEGREVVRILRLIWN